MKRSARMARQPASFVAAALLGASLLTSCGGGDYCGALEELNDVEPGSDEERELIENAADAAPGDVEEEWELVVEASEADPEDPEAIAAAFEALGAYVAIAAHAQEECDVSVDTGL